MVLLAFISEYSPHMLQNYIVIYFPFLANYYGRSYIYIFVASIYVTPEAGKFSNYCAYSFFAVGVICIILQSIISNYYKPSMLTSINTFDGEEEKRFELKPLDIHISE